MNTIFTSSNLKRIIIIFIFCIFALSCGHTTDAILLIRTVAINQKSTQTDPTYTIPVIFRVVFSTPINLSTFTTSDVNTSQSTAPGVSVESITEVAPFNNRSFDVAISATGSGTIVATIPTTVFSYTSSILGTTDSNPQDMTFDSLGNLYTANSGSDNVTKITPGGVSSVLGTTDSSPSDITIDSDGNIYTANSGSDNVTKITPGGVSTIHGTTGLNPLGITIDSDGNIYTANSGSDNVTKITPGGVSSVLGTTDSSPSDITIDSDGNIYTANSGSDNVTKITPGGVSTIHGTTGLNPLGITIDSSGNIYTANAGSDNVTKFQAVQIGSGGVRSAINEVITTSQSTDNSITYIVPNSGSVVFTNPPRIPEGGFIVQINNGTPNTSSPNVVLSFNAGPDVTHVAISNSLNFSNTNLGSYSPTKSWNLCSVNGSSLISPCAYGQKNVYVKFYTSSSGSSAIIPATINYQNAENSLIENESPVVVQTQPIVADQPLESFDFSNKSLYNKLRGKILLKVDDSGKAYYVHHCDKKIFYLGRPNDAFEVIRQQAVGISNTDLKKIPVGIATMSGLDQDNDGLTDMLEDAVGTDKTKADTDGDGYIDRVEIENGYDPLAVGKQVFDLKFARQHLGHFVLQVEGKGEAWYLNPNDSKRYFLGRLTDVFNIMKNMSIGISNEDFDSLF